MKQYQIRLWLCCFILSVTGIAACHSQPRTLPAVSLSSQSWMTQPWTGSDTAFQKTEALIDQRLAQGEAIQTLCNEYQSLAQRSPHDPMAQFAWAYAVHRSATTHHGIVAPDALRALSLVDPGRSYQVARLRFLLIREIAPNNNHTDLEPLGLRLLAHNNQDALVHANLVYDVDTRATVTKALKYAQAWVKQQPQSAGAHAVLASVYDSLFSYSRATNQEYAHKAVAEYQQYLHLAPSNDHFRRQATYLIQVIQTEKPW